MGQCRPPRSQDLRTRRSMVLRRPRRIMSSNPLTTLGLVIDPAGTAEAIGTTGTVMVAVSPVVGRGTVRWWSMVRAGSFRVFPRATRPHDPPFLHPASCQSCSTLVKLLHSVFSWKSIPMATLETFPSGTKSISVEVSIHNAREVSRGPGGLRNRWVNERLMIRQRRLRKLRRQPGRRRVCRIDPYYLASTGTAPGWTPCGGA